MWWERCRRHWRLNRHLQKKPQQSVVLRSFTSVCLFNPPSKYLLYREHHGKLQKVEARCWIHIERVFAAVCRAVQCRQTRSRLLWRHFGASNNRRAAGSYLLIVLLVLFFLFAQWKITNLSLMQQKALALMQFNVIFLHFSAFLLRSW